MSLTELLSELPNYLVLPTLILLIVGFSLAPAVVLNYADRNLPERKAALITIVICAIIGSLIILGNLIFK